MLTAGALPTGVLLTAQLEALAGPSELPPSPNKGPGSPRKGAESSKLGDSMMSFASTSSAAGGSLKPSDIQRAAYKLSLKATGPQQWLKGAREARGAVRDGPVRLVVASPNQMARAVKLTVKTGGKACSAMVNGGAAAIQKVSASAQRMPGLEPRYGMV